MVTLMYYRVTRVQKLTVLTGFKSPWWNFCICHWLSKACASYFPLEMTSPVEVEGAQSVSAYPL